MIRKIKTKNKTGTTITIATKQKTAELQNSYCVVLLRLESFLFFYIDIRGSLAFYKAIVRKRESIRHMYMWVNT